MQPVFLEKGRFDFWKNEIPLHIQLFFGPRGSNATTATENMVIEGPFASEKLSIETLMEELQLVASERISLYIKNIHTFPKLLAISAYQASAPMN